MFSCRRASELVSKRKDEGLTFGETCGLYVHNMMCRLCLDFENQVEILSKAIQKLSQDDSFLESHLAAYSLGPDARKRIKNAVREGAESGSS